MVMGYSERLVQNLLDEFNLAPGSSVLDPFGGSGTTAVQCRKNGLNCWTIDSNPVSTFATTVKTNWNLDPRQLRRLRNRAIRRYPKLRQNLPSLREDPTYRYMSNSGMLKRGWISTKRIYDVIALKKAILELRADSSLENALLLGLATELVQRISNMRFGPEIYCGPLRKGIRTCDVFSERVDQMVTDLENLDRHFAGQTVIVDGDSRELSANWLRPPAAGFDAVISSPPYPTEHDYTRNSRLELALLESVVDRDSLRAIKKRMIRSHTKGIYIEDADSRSVEENQEIAELVAVIDRKAARKKHGFARLYGRVVKEYFGGMALHLTSLHPLLSPNARCAYVLGDQASYLGVQIHTAEILGRIAEVIGYSVIDVRPWRERWATSSRKHLNENILFLQKRSIGTSKLG